MNCPKCGKVVFSRYKFCSYCGATINNEQVNNEEARPEIDENATIIVVPPHYDEAEVEEETSEEIEVEIDTSDEAEVETEIDTTDETEIEVLADEEEAPVEIVEEVKDEEDVEPSIGTDLVEDLLSEESEQEEQIEELTDEPDDNEDDETSEEAPTAVDAEPEAEETPEESEDDEDEDEELEEEAPAEAEATIAEETLSDEAPSEAQESAEEVKNDEEPIPSEEAQQTEEVQPQGVAAPLEEKAKPIVDDKKLRGFRRFINVLSLIVGLIFLSTIAFSYKYVDKLINQSKDIYKLLDTSTNNPVLNEALYLSFGWVISIVIAMSALVILFKTLVCIKNGNEYKDVNKAMIAVSKPALSMFGSNILLYAIYRDTFAIKGQMIVILSLVGLGALLITSLIEKGKMISVSRNKRGTASRYTFVTISALFLIAMLATMFLKMIETSTGKLTLFKYFTFAMNTLNLSASNRYTTSSLVFTYFFGISLMAVIYSTCSHIATKLCMIRRKKRGVIPFQIFVAFIVMLVFYDASTYMFQHHMSKVGIPFDIKINSWLFVAVLMALGALLFDMFRQIVLDIVLQRTKDVIIKHVLMITIFIASIAMLVSYLIGGFSNGKLYIYNLIDSLEEKHIVVLQIIMLIAFAKGVGKILVGFSKSDITDAVGDAVGGISLVFAAIYSNALYPLIYSYRYRHYLEVHHHFAVDFSSSIYIGFVIYAATMLVTIIACMISDKAARVNGRRNGLILFRLILCILIVPLTYLIGFIDIKAKEYAALGASTGHYFLEPVQYLMISFHVLNIAIIYKTMRASVLKENEKRLNYLYVLRIIIIPVIVFICELGNKNIIKKVDCYYLIIGIIGILFIDMMINYIPTFRKKKASTIASKDIDIEE